MVEYCHGMLLKSHINRKTLFKRSTYSLDTWYVVNTWERRLHLLAPRRSTFWQTSVFSLSKLSFACRTCAWTFTQKDNSLCSDFFSQFLMKEQTNTTSRETRQLNRLNYSFIFINPTERKKLNWLINDTLTIFSVTAFCNIFSEEFLFSKPCFVWWILI